MMDPRELQRWAGQTESNIRELGRHVNDLRRFQADMQNAQQIEALQQVMEKQQHHSLSYSNLIILAGYAGFFALWGKLDESLSIRLHALSGLLIMSSLVIFVGWEVTKMTWQAVHLKRVQQMLVSKTPGTNVIAQFQKAQSSFERRAYALWLWFLIPCVVTGFGAAGILIVSFVKSLLHNVA